MKIIYEAYRDLSSKTLVSENINNNYFCHFHRNLELIYVRDGTMNAVINGQKITYSKDDIVFVPSFFSHQFDTPTFSDTLILLIPFELITDFTPFFHKKTLPSRLDDHEFNKNILTTLNLLLFQKKFNNQYTQKGFISIILGLLLQHYPLIPIENLATSDTIIQLLTYIEDHYSEDLTLDTIAYKFGYNSSYLSRLFKSYINVNFKDYINTIRIQHMISLYREQDRPAISTIALQCGFANMPTFYRAFSKLYDVAPKEFFNNLLVDSISHFQQKF